MKGQKKMNCKKIFMALVLVVISSMPLLANPPIPIAYSNEVKKIRYERTVGYIYAPGSTNMMIGYKTESTNAPAAVVHIVTYGVGTNAMFRMWSVETLQVPDEPWKNKDWIYYNNATWITRP